MRYKMDTDSIMNEIIDIKEQLKVMQKRIEQLEVKAEPFIFTIPEPVPSTQACKY